MTTKTYDPTVLRAGMTVLHHHPAWRKPARLVLTQRNEESWSTKDSGAAVIDRYVRSHGIEILASVLDEEPIAVGDRFRRVFNEEVDCFKPGEVYEVHQVDLGLPQKNVYQTTWCIRETASGKVAPFMACLRETSLWARIPRPYDVEDTVESLKKRIEYLRTRDEYFTVVMAKDKRRITQELDHLKAKLADHEHDYGLVCQENAKLRTQLAGLSVRHESLVNDLKRSLSENE